MSIRKRLTRVVYACAFMVLISCSLAGQWSTLSLSPWAALSLWLAALVVTQLIVQALATSIESSSGVPGAGPPLPLSLQAYSFSAAPSQEMPAVSREMVSLRGHFTD